MRMAFTFSPKSDSLTMPVCLKCLAKVDTRDAATKRTQDIAAEAETI